MSILGRLRGYLRGDDIARPAPAPPSVRAAGAAIIPRVQVDRPTWPTADVPVLTRVGYRKCVTAFACVGIIADAVAEATLRAYRDEGEGQRPELPDHPARALIANPNPGRSEAEFHALTVRIAAVAGFCLIEKVRSRSGRVVQLDHLRADWARPIPRAGAPPDWEYRVPGNDPLTLAADDVIAVTYQDAPTLDFAGDTPLLTVLREAGIATGLTDIVKLTLDRGGVPPLVLVADAPGPDDDGLSDAEVAYIREQFAQRYGGIGNWDKPAVVQGVRIERLGLALNDLAYPALRDAIDLSVCRAFRVPAIVVQVLAGIQSSYGQAFDASMRALQVYTCGPLRARLDGAFTRGLLREFDPDPAVSLEFDTSRLPALQEDATARWDRATKAFQATGLTRDEFRQTIGYPALGGDVGDGFYDPTTPVSPVALIPPAGRAATTRRAGLPAKTGAISAGVFAPSLNGHAPKALPARTERRLARLPAETRATVAKNGKAAILRLGREGAPKLAAFWREQGDRIAGLATREQTVPGAMGTIQVRDIAAVNWEAEERALAEVVTAIQAVAGEEAFALVSDTLGVDIDWSLSNPHVKDVLDRLATRIRDIGQTTREDVQRVVGEALDEGVTTAELADRLKALFTGYGDARAMATARTESQVALNSGAVVAYRISDVVDSVEMLDSPTHCDDYGASDGLSCCDRNGLVCPLDQADAHIAAEHVNGSLTVAPILSTPLGEG